MHGKFEDVGRVGLEPTTNALKGRCSTIELPTRVRSRGNVTVAAIRSRFFCESQLREGFLHLGGMVAGLRAGDDDGDLSVFDNK